MKEAFKPLGLVWGDIGRKGTDLNYMLSSLMFRHKDDVDYEEQNAFEEQARALHGLSDIECEEARLQIKEANDDTKLDVDRLLLLGLLYCKGSRIGKSNFLFPVLTKDQLHIMQANENLPRGSIVDNNKHTPIFGKNRESPPDLR